MWQEGCDDPSALFRCNRHHCVSPAAVTANSSGSSRCVSYGEGSSSETSVTGRAPISEAAPVPIFAMAPVVKDGVLDG